MMLTDYNWPDGVFDSYVTEHLDFVQFMPIEIRKLLTKETGKAFLAWEKNPREWEKNAVFSRHQEDRIFSQLLSGTRKEYPWYRPTWVRRHIEYPINRYCMYVFDDGGVAPWYYPVTEWFENRWYDMRNIYTRIFKGYNLNEFGSFSHSHAEHMVPRLKHIFYTYLNDKNSFRPPINLKATDAKMKAQEHLDSKDKDYEPISYTEEEWTEMLRHMVFGYMIKEFDDFDTCDSLSTLTSDTYHKVTMAIYKSQEEGRQLFAKHMLTLYI